MKTHNTYDVKAEVKLNLEIGGQNTEYHAHGSSQTGLQVCYYIICGFNV